MGTVGPGAIHLLNGLYDAKKSHAPVLAICGQVPREDMGSDFFQEVDNDAALRRRRGVQPDRHRPSTSCRTLIEQAVNAAISDAGVAVLTLPGDVGGLDLPKDTRGAPRSCRPAHRPRRRRATCAQRPRAAQRAPAR